MCNLDHFKKINDTFGHAAGDAVLQQGAACFQLCLRNEDILGRLDGEEFGILLVHCNSIIAQERCERLRESLTSVSIHSDNPDFRPSASFGLSSTTSSGYELRRLLADADAALYEAKRSGRNRVVQFGSPTTAQSRYVDDARPMQI